MSATFFSAAAVLQVVFDRFLTDGPIDHTNWWINETNLRRNGAAPASVSGKVVTCPMDGGVISLGPDIANYEPPPFDVLSRYALPAEAYADFPLVVVP
ncbi:hypothetical protein ES703_55067 [subsurface metagenome]